MNFTVRLLTLNCWGLPFPSPLGSKDRAVRMAAIAKRIAAGGYNLVALQEVWSEDDYSAIASAASESLPYAHYFHSGFTGSGVCVLSAWPITDTLMHRYSLNGFAHHIHRGDWFGGKIVGMVQIQRGDVLINLYTTHLHAEYDRDNDLYHPHRVVQRACAAEFEAWELARFVGHTSAGADLAILAGDLNLEPNDVGIRIIKDNARLQDAWLSRPGPGDEGPEGMTCDLPGNLYGYRGDLARCPDGKRIDYVLFNARKGVSVSVKACNVRRDKVSGSPDMDISDHQAIEAVLDVAEDVGGDASFARLNSVAAGAEAVTGERRSVLEKARLLLAEGRARVSSDRWLYAGAVVALVVAAIYTIDLELDRPAVAVFAIPGRFVLSLLIGFCVWHGLVLLTMEEKALRATEEGIQIFLRHKKATE